MPIKDWDATTDANNDDADISSNIDWREGQSPATVNNSARAMMTQLSAWFTETAGGINVIAAASVGGTGDVITITTSQADTYTFGQGFLFIAEGTNTTNITVNVDGQGAKAVNSHGEPLAAGAIVTGDVVLIVHDGTDFELVYPGRQIGVNLELVSDDAGATAGPVISLYRNSASPAASDLLGDIQFYGEDSAGNKEQYATVTARIKDPTSTSEDAELQLYSKTAGTLAQRVLIGAGAYTPNATGGDKGADTINATTLYEDGTAVSAKYFTRAPDYDSGEQTVAVNTTLTLAHGLGAIPRMIEARMRCKTDNHGYVADDEIVINTVDHTSADNGYTVHANSTNVVIKQGDNIGVLDASHNRQVITTTSWRWVVRAWT